MKGSLYCQSANDHQHTGALVLVTTGETLLGSLASIKVTALADITDITGMDIMLVVSDGIRIAVANIG